MPPFGTKGSQVQILFFPTRGGVGLGHSDEKSETRRRVSWSRSRPIFTVFWPRGRWSCTTRRRYSHLGSLYVSQYCTPRPTRPRGEGDVAAAKVALQHVDPPAVPREEDEEEVSLEQAIGEVDAAFPAIADLAREGNLPAVAVERLREACRAFLADDLAPRPPVDVGAERVDIAPEPTIEPSAAASSGAAVIPIR